MHLGRVILHLIARAERRAGASDGEAALHLEIIAWYEASMERVSEWYKRSTQKSVFIIAFIIAIALNIDAVRIGSRLYLDPELRTRVANAAQLVAAQQQAAAASAPGDSTTQALVQQISTEATRLLTTARDAGIPLGWSDVDRAWEWKWEKGRLWGQRLLGWFVVAIACTIGAPFWFDLLQRFVTIRGSGTRPAAVTGAGTADRTAGDGPPEKEPDIVAAAGPPR
jgi:hypothetical protein